MPRKFGFLERWAKLYADQTPAERAIEPHIAKLGVPYRAQHPVFSCGFILDFALLDRKLAIEVDGKSHRGAAAKAADAERTAKLNAYGWTVVRCTNEEALADPAGTVARLMTEGEQHGSAGKDFAVRVVRDRGHRGRTLRHCATDQV